MIQSKQEYLYYVECDKLALYEKGKKPKMFRNEIWKYEILLRKCEYYINCKKNYLSRIYLLFLKYNFKKLSIKLGFSIPFNVFEAGLSIAHYGTIIVNPTAQVGKNCRIHPGVVIGATNGINKAPHMGDNIYIASGAKIIGNIYIADGIAIACNAVVVDDIMESNITVGGIPAKKISSNNSDRHLLKATDIINRGK